MIVQMPKKESVFENLARNEPLMGSMLAGIRFADKHFVKPADKVAVLLTALDKAGYMVVRKPE